MSDNAQPARNSQFTEGSSNATSQTSPDPFVSTVLAQLGLGNQYVPVNTSLKSLLSELHNPVWQIRAAAARQLGKLGEKEVIEPLVTILTRDTMATVKIAAVRALGELANYAPVEPLIAALDDPTDDVKAAAAWALGELGERVPTSLPLENLLNSRNAAVRMTAIRALGELGTRTPVHILAASFQDPDWQVREMAALALAKQDERFTHSVFESGSGEQDIL